MILVDIRGRNALTATAMFQWTDALLSMIALATGRQWIWTFHISADTIKFIER